MRSIMAKLVGLKLSYSHMLLIQLFCESYPKIVTTGNLDLGRLSPYNIVVWIEPVEVAELTDFATHYFSLLVHLLDID